MFSLTKEELVFMAQACEEAEKYQDMLSYAKLLMLQTPDENPTIEERDLLASAFRLNISEKKTSWELVSSLEEGELLKGDKNAHLVVQFKKTIEQELKEICYDYLDFVEKNLLYNYQTAHSRVFFSKMKGDWSRYLLEYLHGSEKSEVKDKCLYAYEKATEIAEAELSAADSIRLGLALNFAVFWADNLGNVVKAFEIANKAANDAYELLDELDDEDYKEATRLIQLLRENETFWMEEAQMPKQDEQDDEQDEEQDEQGEQDEEPDPQSYF